MTDTAVAVTTADEAVVTREYIVRIRVQVPAGTDIAALDAAMKDVLDDEGAAQSIEDSLFYDHEEVADSFDGYDERFGVKSFTMDDPT